MSYSISFFKSGLRFIPYSMTPATGRWEIVIGMWCGAIKCLWHGVKVGGSASFPAASDLKVSFY